VEEPTRRQLVYVIVLLALVGGAVIIIWVLPALSTATGG